MAMSKYTIKSIGKVDYGDYKGVVRVTASKVSGFWASLFFPPEETYFVISEGSPLYEEVNVAKRNNSNCDIPKISFVAKKVNGIVYRVEKSLAFYEREKAKRLAEVKRKADEKRKVKDLQAQRKKQETDKENKEEKANKQIDTAFKKSKLQKISLANFLVCVDENASFSDQMAGIAGNVNLCFATGNRQGVTDNLVLLYTKVQGYNSHLLKNLEAKNGQVVGLAFIKMALYFTNGNFWVNEVAAQNAFYCLAKNYFLCKNTIALPALFTLLFKRPQTIEDELYTLNPDPDLAGFGGMTPSAPYRKTDRVMENRLLVMKYILSKFYDERKKVFLIDTTLPYHIPSQEDVNMFYKELQASKFDDEKDMLAKGEEYFKNLYEIVDDHLNL